MQRRQSLAINTLACNLLDKSFLDIIDEIMTDVEPCFCFFLYSYTDSWSSINILDIYVLHIVVIYTGSLHNNVHVWAPAVNFV